MTDTMSMADDDDHEGLGTRELPPLAEKTVQHRVKTSTFSYCPTLDLLALASQDERVYVYRLNGQRVVGTGSKKPGLQVREVHWKPNGAVRRLSKSRRINMHILSYR